MNADPPGTAEGWQGKGGAGRMEAALIRAADAKDAADVQAIATDFATSFQEEASAFQRAFAELLTAPQALLAVAEADGRIVRYVLGFAHAAFYANGNVAWVGEIAVRPDLRGKGNGRQLTQRMEEWARERDCKLVSLATRRAEAFYEHLGYTPSAKCFRKLLLSGFWNSFELLKVTLPSVRCPRVEDMPGRSPHAEDQSTPLDCRNSEAAAGVQLA